MNFNGQKIVVTGGTGVLGSAVTERLLAGGARCIVTSIAPVVEASFPFKDHPGVTVVTSCDLASESAVEALYRSVGELWASVHVAGAFAMAPLLETSLADFDRMLSLNLRTAFLCTREAVRHMPSGGRIVNVTARPGLDPTAGGGMVGYAVSKAGVAALTESTARELHGRGIWVNAVAPSTIDTPANRAAMPGADHASWPSPAELAETIAWLCSGDNRVTSGALVPVYGRTWP